MYVRGYGHDILRLFLGSYIQNRLTGFSLHEILT